MDSIDTIPASDLRAARRSVTMVRQHCVALALPSVRSRVRLTVHADAEGLRGEASFTSGGDTAMPPTLVRAALRPLLARPGLEGARIDIRPAWSLLRVAGRAAVLDHRSGEPIPTTHAPLVDALTPLARSLPEGGQALLLARFDAPSAHERMAMAAAHAVCGWCLSEAYAHLIGFTLGEPVWLRRQHYIALIVVPDRAQPGGLSIPVAFAL